MAEMAANSALASPTRACQDYQYARLSVGFGHSHWPGARLRQLL